MEDRDSHRESMPVGTYVIARIILDLLARIIHISIALCIVIIVLIIAQSFTIEFGTVVVVFSLVGLFVPLLLQIDTPETHITFAKKHNLDRVRPLLSSEERNLIDIMVVLVSCTCIVCISTSWAGSVSQSIFASVRTAGEPIAYFSTDLQTDQENIRRFGESVGFALELLDIGLASYFAGRFVRGTLFWVKEQYHLRIK